MDTNVHQKKPAVEKKTYKTLAERFEIKYPYTEDGTPSCLGNECPRRNECRVCCKDWREE